jgi:DNA (cytosine-5)-methyltransferase 1
MSKRHSPAARMPATKTAEHRPAVRRRRFAHDDLIAVDMFSGFGGLTTGIKLAGFETIMAANHNRYKVQVHEANHPEAEHWIADLDDPEFEASVTRSERDRATANCVLHYAAHHHPRLILIECTTELTSWGPQVPGKKKCGDGTTYRWWLHQFDLLGYKYRVLYLNSMFFGVPQSRDRLYIAFWDQKIPTPDLDHRPPSWCGGCDRLVEAVWTWKTGVPPTGTVRYGKQYEYRCPSCRCVVIPPMTPSLAALDLSNLGTRIGDRKKPLAPATMARAERCRQRFAEFPAVLMPTKATRGSDKHVLQPMATQTSQQEVGLLSTGQVFAAHRHNGDGKHISQPMDTVTSTHEKAVLLAVDNFQGAPRGAGESLPTQGGSETLALLSSGVVPFRRNTIPTAHGEAMPTVTAEQIPGILTAAGRVQLNGSINEAARRTYPLERPLGTVVGSAITQGLLFSGWINNNGDISEAKYRAHPVTDPLGAVTSENSKSLLTAEWHAKLSDLALEDCYFRMMAAHEIGRGCGFDVTFADYTGTFVVWGSPRDQVDGFGNAVSPPVGEWAGSRLRAALHGVDAA